MGNEYNFINSPDNDRSHNNGYMYEHILVIEESLGRKLKLGEVVHHEDRNKRNNDAANLSVFKTNTDHSRFHKTGIRIADEHGVYSSPSQRVCIKCGKPTYASTNRSKTGLCKDCHIECMERKVKTIPTKENLEELLYNKVSFCEMGRIYGISDNGIRKWFKKFGLPYRKKDIKIDS